MKFVLWVAVGIGFCACYFTIQRLHLVEPVKLPLTCLDRAIPFEPAWVWVYQSLYLLIVPSMWLARDRSDIRRYFDGLVLMSGTCFAIFLAWPVACPRPEESTPTGLYALVTACDTPLNSFPSLHAGWLAYALAFMRRVAAPLLPTVVWAVLLVWGLAILASTLFTKQHYAVDLLGGAAIALACDAITWRGSGIKLDGGP